MLRQVRTAKAGTFFLFFNSKRFKGTYFLTNFIEMYGTVINKILLKKLFIPTGWLVKTLSLCMASSGLVIPY